MKIEIVTCQTCANHQIVVIDGKYHIEEAYCRLKDAGKWSELEELIEAFPWKMRNVARSPEQASWEKDLWLQRMRYDREDREKRDLGV